MGCSNAPEKENKPKRKNGEIQGQKAELINKKSSKDEIEFKVNQINMQKEDSVKLKKAEAIQFQKAENLIIKENLINDNKYKKEKNKIKQNEEYNNNENNIQINNNGNSNNKII